MIIASYYLTIILCYTIFIVCASIESIHVMPISIIFLFVPNHSQLAPIFPTRQKQICMHFFMLKKSQKYITMCLLLCFSNLFSSKYSAENLALVIIFWINWQNNLRKGSQHNYMASNLYPTLLSRIYLFSSLYVILTKLRIKQMPELKITVAEI